ncbi:uncharacterized protein LOC130901909 isoform X2 [Diorhabda carinulata]|uniref:uncharacterized protein LOC130901909 isoform X2 n=1 Tax=Diorhabda carinulata TaxID=1163345 RepID=UPI0025A187B0|nr:uncharacterized protein LOC130901909 isoform X2 [Diorhabda carinulata]
MAARSDKIFREILFKHYRYNSKIVSPIFSNVTRTFTQNVTKKKVTLLKLTKNLLEKEFVNSNLQPALLPAFSTYQKIIEIKKPSFQQTNTNDVFPRKKFSDYLFSNLVQTDGLTAQARHFSTLQSSTRHYSNKKWGNQMDAENCPPAKKSCKACPKWQLHNCPPQADNLDCAKPYTDPCCKKKLAPYPSYSELCAERLEDDPSECMQCPWSKCGGVDNLKYPKRRYHTGTRAAFYRFPTTVDVPLLNITQNLVPINCDAKKPPCKRPPGKCDRIQKTEPCPEPQKGPCPPPFERKKCDKEKKAKDRWVDVYRMWADKNNVVPEDWSVIIPVEEQTPAAAIQTKKEDICNEDRITPDNSCCLKLPFDKKQMDYESIRHKQCHKPNCRRKKRKMVPDGCDGSCNKKCASPINATLSNNGMELAKEHDKGHPPPCPNWRKPSKQCPKPEKCKRPYRQEHDLHEPFYRRQKRPWPEIDTGHGERKPDLYS